MSRYVTDTHGLLVLHLLHGDSDNYLIAPLTLDVAMILTQIGRDIVPDMPDRIIAATALHLDLPLLTRDRRIRRVSSVNTIW